MSCEIEKGCEGFSLKHYSAPLLPGRQHSLIRVMERKWCKWQSGYSLSGFSFSGFRKVVVILVFSYLVKKSKKGREGFPGGAVVKNPPANAGDTGSSAGPGRSHMPRSS